MKRKMVAKIYSNPLTTKISGGALKTLSTAAFAACVSLSLANPVNGADLASVDSQGNVKITSEALGTSQNINWKELPEKPADDALNIIELKLPNDFTQYFQYKYKTPDGYASSQTRLKDNLTTDNVNKVLFHDISLVNSGTDVTQSSGAVIYNTKDNSNIDIFADFKNNKIISESHSNGGAIYNKYGKLGNINGDFIENSITSSYFAYGGAIFNGGTSSIIGNITGDFIGNSVSASIDSSAFGGAIYNEGKIGAVTGDFIGNYITVKRPNAWYFSAYGAAICNQLGTIDSIKGNFVANTITDYGAGMFGPSGAAVANVDGKIGNIEGDFIGNSVSGDGRFDVGYLGGAILNLSNEKESKIGNIDGDFIGNFISGNDSSAGYGGAIYNAGQIGNITGDLIGNYVSTTGSGSVYGGAIYNDEGLIGEKDSAGNLVGGFINSSIVNNYVKTDSGEALGGAIVTTKDLNFIADNHMSVIQGNYTQVGEEKDDNAIFVASPNATLNFKLQNGGKVAMYDNIRGLDGYKVDITGDSIDNTMFYMYNDMYDANLTFGNTTINTINNDIHVYNVNNLTLNGDTNMVADVDLVNKEMDRFTASSYGDAKHNGNLNVIGMNLLNDAPEGRDFTAIYFAENGLKDNVTHNGLEVPNEKYQDFQVLTPIYKYNVTYDKEHQYDGKGEGGYFIFTKGDKYFRPTDPTDPDSPVVPTPGGNESDAYNPAVLSTPVLTQAAGQSAMTETFRYVFEHADAFTQLPALDRFAVINENQYAIASTDFNQNISYHSTDLHNKGVWVRPYTSFENIHLSNGPKVDTINYGTLIGFDSDFKKLAKGWTNVSTAYIGYNGSQINYNGVDTSMNGGLLGLTETFYKGNFWTAITSTVGAGTAQTRTMYGNEDSTILMGGIGSKTGYNFEFKEGKYILQPIMFLSYTFVNTFDYTNAAGVRINSDPMHTIQVNPNVRFISNTKNGWQPYAQVGMVWNLMNETSATANGIKLPEMHTKPYVEYGLGIQKRMKDRFTAFGQAMIRNGGRNGIAITAGFRWALGKDDSHIEKVNAQNNKKLSSAAALDKNITTDL
ncbi:MAG: autotransporter outer membrane beta-barrel domain-containing protein [Candidatus Gastranaerophilales bacterium]|nr:autotransporter outer membrane beta-barrel domain-containing protein [Candidatus Gastranaerophilales bacterium]MCM1073922.1 autotransporter outer membrane beta-barrel domain-containing protein [Bacteroides sp.]